jgi:ubiquinone biosynthesis protein
VLVLEELKGEPLHAYRERAKTDPQIAKKIATLALGEILSQIFEDGRFHADPHAGNLLILEDGRLGLIDLGLTGEFTRDSRRHIARAVKALLARDADGLIRALLAFGSVPDDFDSEAFKRDVTKVVSDRKEALLGLAGKGAALGLDKLVNELFRTAYRHRVYVPQATTLLIKTLVTVEGVARQLDPEINLVSVAVPVILRSLTPKWLRLFGRS